MTCPNCGYCPECGRGGHGPHTPFTGPYWGVDRTQGPHWSVEPERTSGTVTTTETTLDGKEVDVEREFDTRIEDVRQKAIDDFVDALTVGNVHFSDD